MLGYMYLSADCNFELCRCATPEVFASYSWEYVFEIQDDSLSRLRALNSEGGGAGVNVR